MNIIFTVSSHHHELEESKNSLEEASGEDKYVLVKRRDEGLAEAMELQTEESLHSLEVFVSCMQATQHTFEYFNESQPSVWDGNLTYQWPYSH